MTSLIHSLFSLYTILLFLTILGSWVPSLSCSPLMRWVARLTLPYLQVFKRFIPAMGPLDLSPLVAFLALQFMEKCLLSLVR